MIECDSLVVKKRKSQCEGIFESFPLCIDAYIYGNISRYMNHSCDPNVVSVAIHLENRNLFYPRIFIFASKDIQPFEELTLNYNCSPLNIRKELRCLCGAKNCKRFVYQPES